MKILVAHPTGNRNVRAILSSLFERQMLAAFHSTVALTGQEAWIKRLPAALQQELLRRSYPIPSALINAHPWREVLRMVAQKGRLQRLLQPETGWASIDAIYRDLDQRVAQSLRGASLDAVYAYEDGALETFRRAKDLGLTCIYDLPIAYWETGRQLMQQEAERYPNWVQTLGGSIQDSSEKTDRKTQELALADVVITSGSFVSDSLPAFARAKDQIVSPFGSPLTATPEPRSAGRGPLRVLFAGSMGQRKGLADLFAAVQQLPKGSIELVVMGSLLAPLSFYRQQYADFTYEAGRPHDQVLALMRSCDVFCLPSIVEGRALVMQEAMSQGLPLIITPNTGGADLILEGETGFLVPIRSPERIAEKLVWFLEHRDAIPEMGRQAQQHAARYTWERYGQRIATALQGLPTRTPMPAFNQS